MVRNVYVHASGLLNPTPLGLSFARILPGAVQGHSTAGLLHILLLNGYTNPLLSFFPRSGVFVIVPESATEGGC